MSDDLLRRVNPHLEIKAANLDVQSAGASRLVGRGDLADQRVSLQKFHNQVTDTFTARSFRRCDLQILGIHSSPPVRRVRVSHSTTPRSEGYGWTEGER